MLNFRPYPHPRKFSEPHVGPESRAVRCLSDTGAVIVSHRRADLARACAERVLKEIDGRSIVVVVNAPNDAMAPDLDWLAANVGVLVRNKDLRGYGANVNEGVRRMPRGLDYYLLTNDDVLLERGAITALRDTLENEPTTAIAGPRLVGVTGETQQSVYRFPSISSEVASAVILPARFHRWLSMKFMLARDTRGEAFRNGWLVGAALLVRAAAFNQVDGFDEQFFMYSEETDLSFRLSSLGWAARLCEGISAVHFGGESTVGRRYRRMLGVSKGKYVLKHWPKRNRVMLRVALTGTYGWNSVYVLCRILLDPRSLRAKTSLWKAHWATRPYSSRRPRHARRAANV